MDLTNTLKPAAGALVGATVAGVVSTGAPAMDIMTSVSGAAGSAIGYVAGTYVGTLATFQGTDGKPNTLGMAAPFIGAAAVPGLASGIWDADTIVLAVGAAAGAMLIAKFFP